MMKIVNSGPLGARLMTAGRRRAADKRLSIEHAMRWAI